MLLALAIGALSTAAVSQSQAAFIIGDISFTGSVALNGPISTATQVNNFFDGAGNINKADIVLAAGNYAAFVTPGVTVATMAAPWIFNPSTATPALWSAGGFTFDLASSSIVLQNNVGNGFLVVSGLGTVTGNGFQATAGSWSFSANGPANGTTGRFSFSAGTNSVPEGGSSIALLGLGLISLPLLRKKFRR